MPNRTVARPRVELASTESPQITLRAANNPAHPRFEAQPLLKLPAFALPEETRAVPPSKLVAQEIAAPVIPVAQQPAALILGLDPAPAAEPLLAPGSRGAQFSAGEAVVPGSDPAALPSIRADIRVPHLGIAPAASAAAAGVSRPPVPLPDRSAWRRQLLSTLARPPAGLPSARGPQNNTAVPDGVLHGGTIYTLAIDMPNISSYEGSWTLRFSELGGSSPEDLVRPPVAVRKVDPKYIAAAAAERVEGNVLLYAVIRRDGQVDRIRLVQGIDERLDTSAVAAFAKWEFQPATRNGLPVDLEAVVQIPFRLAPRRKD